MVAAYHLIWSAYACWLPNDPRGSSSHEIRIPEIANLGELYQGRKRIQPAFREIRDFYATADPVLKHERLLFTDSDIALLAVSFGQTIKQQRYTCYGCAIMQDHVHFLIRKHRDKAEQMIEHFQVASRQTLIDAGRRSANHPVWGGPGWKVFLDTRDDIQRVAEYIRNNPMKAGRLAQNWEFVRIYDGWLPGNPYRTGKR